MTARARAKTTAELYAFSRKLAGIGALDDLLWATAYQIASMLNVRTVLLMPEPDATGSKWPRAIRPRTSLDEADMAAARWSWEHNRAAGRGADTLARRQMAVSAAAHRQRAGRRDRHRPRCTGPAC